MPTVWNASACLILTFGTLACNKHLWLRCAISLLIHDIYAIDLIPSVANVTYSGECAILMLSLLADALKSLVLWIVVCDSPGWQHMRFWHLVCWVNMCNVIFVGALNRKSPRSFCFVTPICSIHIYTASHCLPYHDIVGR